MLADKALTALNVKSIVKALKALNAKSSVTAGWLTGWLARPSRPLRPYQSLRLSRPLRLNRLLRLADWLAG